MSLERIKDGELTALTSCEIEEGDFRFSR